eukprot:51382-Eustigmatos_ZCMA.PRE.2
MRLVLMRSCVTWKPRSEAMCMSGQHIKRSAAAMPSFLIETQYKNDPNVYHVTTLTPRAISM